MNDLKLLFAEFEDRKDENGKDVEERYEERKKVLRMFQQMFSEEGLKEMENKDVFLFLGSRFMRWSWTDLSVNKWEFVEKIDEFKRLIRYMRDETIPVEERIENALKKFKIRNLTPCILSGILFVLHPEKYGVWSSDNERALRLLGRLPKLTGRVGEDYKRINEKFHELAEELDVDLLKLDMFLSYVANREDIIKREKELLELGIYESGERKEVIFEGSPKGEEVEVHVSQIFPGG
ncbi:MAG: hypothetical protein PWR09_817, partial [Archaeoglobi archaeon]|nr:hypothetical protein [Archaeoglobi archaeon]